MVHQQAMPLSAEITIVMPAYRAEAAIVGAVRSVLAQSFAGWQLLVVSDDGADYEVVLGAAGIADRRCRFIGSGGVRSGASAARNAGLEAVTTDYVAVLDADDRFRPEKLARVVAALGAHAIVSTALAVTDALGRLLRRVGEGPDRVVATGQHKWVNFSMDSMIAWDRRRVEARYDPGLPNMNDLDFLLRLYRGSANSLHIGEPLHVYVKQPTSLSNGAGFTERMIAAKTLIRERLAGGYYALADPGGAEGMDRFLAVSLTAEQTYPAALALDPALLFEDHIEPLLIAAVTSAS
jgi:glycosyltransferase involved in cell wall biosynthesis